jgi:hypothetical protein
MMRGNNCHAPTCEAVAGYIQPTFNPESPPNTHKLFLMGNRRPDQREP